MHLRLLVCLDCHTVYASPAPTVESLDAAYRGAAYDSSVEARYAASTYVKALRRVLGSPASWGPVLDIGAGDGAFLDELLSFGLSDLIGVEPSEAPIGAAKDAVRPFLRHRSFEAGDFIPASFGLITCFQTIEHVADPLALCRGAQQLLRPGGHLVLVCHDYRALLNRLMGTRSPIYDIEHLQLLTREPLRLLLVRSGLSPVTVRRLVNRYPLRYWARLAPMPHWVKTWSLQRLPGPVGSLAIPIPVGNLLAFGRA
jgi:SAM-dependent methyltransferase